MKQVQRAATCFIHTRWSKTCPDCPATMCPACGGWLPKGGSYYHVCQRASWQTVLMTVYDFEATR